MNTIYKTTQKNVLSAIHKNYVIDENLIFKEETG